MTIAGHAATEHKCNNLLSHNVAETAAPHSTTADTTPNPASRRTNPPSAGKNGLRIRATATAAISGWPTSDKYQRSLCSGRMRRNMKCNDTVKYPS